MKLVADREVMQIRPGRRQTGVRINVTEYPGGAARPRWTWSSRVSGLKYRIHLFEDDNGRTARVVNVIPERDGELEIRCAGSGGHQDTIKVPFKA